MSAQIGLCIYSWTACSSSWYNQLRYNRARYFYTIAFFKVTKKMSFDNANYLMPRGGVEKTQASGSRPFPPRKAGMRMRKSEDRRKRGPNFIDRRRRGVKTDRSVSPATMRSVRHWHAFRLVSQRREEKLTLQNVPRSAAAQNHVWEVDETGLLTSGKNWKRWRWNTVNHNVVVRSADSYWYLLSGPVSK